MLDSLKAHPQLMSSLTKSNLVLLMELENKEEEAADDDEMVNKDTLIVLSRY